MKEIVVENEVVVPCKLYARLHTLINSLAQLKKHDVDFHKVNKNCEEILKALEECKGVTVEEVKKEPTKEELQTKLF